MIGFKIKFNGKKVRIKEYGIKPLQMLRIGQAGLDHLKKRVSFGIGLDDTAMPPLKIGRTFKLKDGRIQKVGAERGYIGYKKKHGGKAIRDLRLTGAMLDNLSVRSATANQVRIGFTTKLARQKAASNQRIAPWLGWSDSDIEQGIVPKAKQLFKADVSNYFQQVKRSFRK